MFDPYHVLLPFSSGGTSDFLEQRILGIKEGSSSHRLSDGRILFYTGQAPTDEEGDIDEDTMHEAADRLEAEDAEIDAEG